MPTFPNPNSRHLLLVDDEPALVAELATYLRRRGWVVSVSHSADEALALMADTPDICVVVTDMLMPDLTGYQLAQTCEAASVSPAVGLVIMTGCGELLADTSGCNIHVLPKPLDMPYFLDTLETAYAGASTARANGSF